MSVEEWRELERNSHDAKHEYIDGQVYFMARGTADHARIGSNVVHALEDALGDSPCNVYNSDLSVRISETRYTYPDASVTCDERDQGHSYMLQSPRLIVEVLSDTTEAYDRGKKFALYRQWPTLEEYVLISTDQQSIEVFHRMPEGWMVYQARIYGPSDTVELASINASFPVAALY